MWLLLFLPLLLSGCTGLMSGKPPGPWYNYYQPIHDPASDTFLSNVLVRAEHEFGEPVIPIKKIMLRRSKKTKAARRYRLGEDFSQTQCVDRTNGVFVIYIGADPGKRDYYALLAHECVHLLNANITDWYMEGMATVFSEQACAALGKPWGDWKRYFEKSRYYPYALSYRMMRALQQAFPKQYPAMIRDTAPHEGKKPSEWLRIDIDRWIDSLPAERRDEARNIIAPYAAILRKNINKIYDFTVPGTQ